LLFVKTEKGKALRATVVNASKFQQRKKLKASQSD
jgi:hypothetical protein